MANCADRPCQAWQAREIHRSNSKDLQVGLSLFAREEPPMCILGPVASIDLGSGCSAATSATIEATRRSLKMIHFFNASGWQCSGFDRHSSRGCILPQSQTTVADKSYADRYVDFFS